MNNHFDVIIIGGGAAGLTAGIYLSRAKLSTLILNEGTVGGQMVLTHEIANYPGIESISGYQLARNMKAQAQKFGCTIKSNLKITGIELSGDMKQITVNESDVYTSNAVIIATGGKSRTIGVPGEENMKGKGISYCATCDGDFFQDKEIIVVGGGNSALEEAVSLTKYASKVTIVHQFDHFQAFEHYVEEAKLNSKINFIMESKIVEFIGDEKLTGVKIQNIASNEIAKMTIEGVFIFIGYVPNTEKLDGMVELNQWKEIVVDKNMATNIPGVYAAGDSIAKRYRQVTTAVADGTIAALSAADYLNSLKKAFIPVEV
ncbi:MAG: thioredoxin-disulfide reductase [Stygiobacter sp. RIFOXYC12_FULL_38_8]|nr:MAG: thioredoxin-disulfide reductase [Stygiobacter sp. GWC2_38_9]OGU82803.1 MAG: thioredoxin-disulfide reductase [Stygiobacter sp. RIFOXYA12_FULL_38_9]OGV06601.1 MAG: thioredoxin-disulfide reductase [Stygiobacter sp. RIFOXYB2_FULL_37_11]OGV13137.1 MAG: thioredoxin-disulfide reductase [Stygiobacter sp. RIFOXYC2_FULL_38_25]OGV17035.1 MAG: thioredoxin-disulfide reductase [Stygiobacter sp. RIFOXYA2_FULL_38_8]OGV23071.1 MAG: thioredoxin-disulfide reductase [Stygiobacter sp. RIFOXYC12_FULL_38_8]